MRSRMDTNKKTILTIIAVPVLSVILLCSCVVENNHQKTISSSDDATNTVYASSVYNGIRLDVVNTSMTNHQTDIEVRISGKNYKNFAGILRNKPALTLKDQGGNSYWISEYSQLNQNSSEGAEYYYEFKSNQSIKKSTKMNFLIGGYWSLNFPVSYLAPLVYKPDSRYQSKFFSFTISSVEVYNNQVEFYITINNASYSQNFMSFFGNLTIGDQKYPLYSGGLPSSLSCPAQMEMDFNTKNTANTMKLDIEQMNSGENIKEVASFNLNLQQ